VNYLTLLNRFLNDAIRGARGMKIPNQDAEQSGKVCVVGGQVQNDLNELDCEEAKKTNCVQRLLTPAQYSDCLNAQNIRKWFQHLQMLKPNYAWAIKVKITPGAR
jgi:hypothetical protein